jgi:fimbrial chaperone protein
MAAILRHAGFASLVCVWACGALPVPARASTFNISPIRAELSATHRTDVLTLTNAEDQPVVVQVHVLAWSQQNGEERLDETRELLATPPVLQIPASSDQIVRVALRREADPSRELTYRVILEEIPQAAPANFNGLRVALRLSVPVFVAPARGTGSSDLVWGAHLRPDGEVEVAASNHGTGHLQVTDFELYAGAATPIVHGMTSKYVLPGSRMTWMLKADADPRLTGPIVIRGHSDRGDFTADVALSGL